MSSYMEYLRYTWSHCRAKRHDTGPMRDPNFAGTAAGASQMVLLRSHITSAHPVPMQQILCVYTAESCPYYWNTSLTSKLLPETSQFGCQNLFLDLKVQGVACEYNRQDSTVQIFTLWNTFLMLSAKRNLYDPAWRIRNDKVLSGALQKSEFHLLYIIWQISYIIISLLLF